VLEHWHQVFKGTELTQQFVKGHVVEADDVANLNTILPYIAVA
jgi:hypothetical protein